MRALLRTGLLAVSLLLGPASAHAAPQTTAFTYQGQLKQDGQPFTGTVNLQFRLWDDPIAGAEVAPLVTRNAVPVQDGIFTVEIDFGASFGVDQRWVEVIANGVLLSPRQPVTTAPMAIFALTGLQGPVGPEGAQGPQGEPGPTGTPVLVFGGTVRQSHLRVGSALASFGTVTGSSEALTTIDRAEMIVPHACVASDLRAGLADSPGTYGTSTVTLMVNGTASALACTANAGGECSNIVDTAALAAGDRLALRLQPAMPFAVFSNRESSIHTWLKFGFSCSEAP